MLGSQVLLETVLVLEIKDPRGQGLRKKEEEQALHQATGLKQSSRKCTLHRGHVTSTQPNLTTLASPRAPSPETT